MELTAKKNFTMKKLTDEHSTGQAESQAAT